MNRLAAILSGFVVGAIVPPARAQLLDDFLQHGYGVIRSTTFAGGFDGCRRGQELSFADGSTFLCATTLTLSAYAPRVYILRQAADPPSVLIIGGHLLGGALTRLGGRALPVPLNMQIDALDLKTLPRLPPALLRPAEPILSINDIIRQQWVRLNDAQSKSLDRSGTVPR